MLKTKDCFDLSHSLAGDYLKKYEYPWQALSGIKELILDLGNQLGDEYEEVQPQVWVHKTAKVFPSAYLGSPCIIGARTEVRHCILGYYSHMGAGAVTSNVKSDHSLVTLREGDQKIGTGLKKFGAILADYVEVGCNSVLNPGTVIGSHSRVYPTTGVRGFVPENSIVKKTDVIVRIKEER